jgi:hypothetical protein
VFGTARHAGLPDRDGGVATAASDHIRSFSSTSRNTLCYFMSVLNSHPPFSNPYRSGKISLVAWHASAKMLCHTKMLCYVKMLYHPPH